MTLESFSYVGPDSESTLSKYNADVAFFSCRGVSDDGIVSDVKFETFGCGSAIASSSMATELIKGKPVSEVLTLTNKAVVEALDGLPPHKIHCSVLAEEAIKQALKDYYDKNGIEYDKSLFPTCEDCHNCCSR